MATATKDRALTAPKTWEEAVAVGKLGLPQVAGYTLWIDGMFGGETEYGEYLSLSGRIENGPHAGVEFGGTTMLRLYIGKHYIVEKLQQRVRSLPFRVQFGLQPLPSDPSKSYYAIQLLTFGVQSKNNPAPVPVQEPIAFDNE